MRVGVDLGGTKIEAARIDDAGNFVERRRVASPRRDGYEAIVRAIADLVRGIAPDATAVGIGTPGTVSSTTGHMKNSNSTELNGRPLRQDLEAALGLPVRLANDANCFALSEAHGGAGAGHRVVFGVILGTGVGGGIVIDGRVHDGPNGIAGEWGHTPLVPDGPPCYCGRRGCVETVLSGPGLASSYAGASADAAEIARRAAAGEPAAREALALYVDRLGRGLATVVDILDPDVIVLGGGVSGIEALYRDVPAAVLRHVFSDDFRTPVVKNVFGDSGGVRGAAMLVT
jgi:fructokinase